MYIFSTRIYLALWLFFKWQWYLYIISLIVIIIIPSLSLQRDDGVPMQNVYRESRLECTNRMRWPYIYVNSEHCTLFRAKWEDTLHLSQSNQFVFSLWSIQKVKKKNIYLIPYSFIFQLTEFFYKIIINLNS